MENTVETSSVGIEETREVESADKAVDQKTKKASILPVILLLMIVVGGILIWRKISPSNETESMNSGSGGRISVWAGKTPSYELVKEIDGVAIKPSETAELLTWPQVGIWQGLLPCDIDLAGCRGKEVELRLYRENGAVTGDPYQLITSYHGVSKAEPEVKTGIWTTLDGTISDAQATVYALDIDRPGHLIFFQVNGETIEKLDDNQQRYESN